MKFKVGDTVKVVKQVGKTEFCKGYKIGSVGKVRKVEKGLPYPYYVGRTGLFIGRELKLIKKGR